jgi:hypothetical protein
MYRTVLHKSQKKLLLLNIILKNVIKRKFWFSYDSNFGLKHLTIGWIINETQEHAVVTRSTETLINFYQSTRRCMPEHIFVSKICRTSSVQS